VKEVVVISGKGGTGKTSITAAIVTLEAAPKVVVDLDVDAPDLHLVLCPQQRERHEFFSGHIAVVRKEDCTGCGICAEVCAFSAVSMQDAVAVVDPAECEGCKLCVELCEAGAIDFPERHCGQWFVSSSRAGTMVHARLFPGEENSGRLVSLLKTKARELAQAEGVELIICDGAPGIACPVISSLSGADAALIVAEPTPSGLHDMSRVLELCGHFGVKGFVVVNKSDLNPEVSAQLKEAAGRAGAEVVAEVGFDMAVVEAAIAGKSVWEFAPDSPTSRAIARAWREVKAALD